MPMTPFGTCESMDLIESRIRFAEICYKPLAKLLMEKVQSNPAGSFQHKDARRELEIAKYEILAAEKLREHFGL